VELKKFHESWEQNEISRVLPVHEEGVTFRFLAVVFTFASLPYAPVGA